MRLCDCAIQPVTELFHPGFNCVTYLCVHPASNPDVKYGRIAGTRNEWQNEKWVAKKMASFPLYRPLSPPYGIALCYISFIFHQLVQLLNFIMIFNAILSVNHLVIYTQFNNLLFPRKSCSIGFPYPLESIHPVRKPNVVIFAPFVPIWFTWWAFYWIDNSVLDVFFLRTISVKSGIEPVYLRQSNYTSTFVHIRALNFVKRNKTTRKSVRKYKFIKELCYVVLIYYKWLQIKFQKVPIIFMWCMSLCYK